MSNKNDERRINLGYVLDQLERALTSTGKTGAARATQWRRVLAGIFEGTLRHGSRTPVADTPPWVTLEVAHGGFATGQFKAAGPLQQHEIEQLRRIERDPAVTDRAALNAHFLSDAGRAELRERLRSGHYRIVVPEEAALLVVTWLIDHGDADRAEAVLNQIAPFLDRLRFYPVAADSPSSQGEGVYVQSAASVAAALRGKAPNPNVEAMKEAIKVWTPLYDRTVDLFLETVEGESPRLAKDNGGVLLRQSNGSPIVEGGWPCRRFDDGWPDRARRILVDYERERSLHQLSGKPRRPKENFARLRGYLERAAKDSETLTGRDVGMIRWILASYLTKHGSPGSAQRTATRDRQREEAGRPSHHELARILAGRIEQVRSEGGLTDIDATIAPITAEEATETVVGGSIIPPSLAEKAQRCVEAPIETLVARKIVRSSEVVATLLPQLTGEIRAGAIADTELRTLYASVYRSFRQRRSLLLLDLQSQVRLEELPWLAAITPGWGRIVNRKRQRARRCGGHRGSRSNRSRRPFSQTSLSASFAHSPPLLT